MSEPAPAQLSATLLSGVRVVYGVVRSRRIDPFAHDGPQADSGRQHPRERHRRADLPGQLRRRRIHVQLSAMWGIGLLIEVLIRLVVIDHLSVDAANGVNSAITLPVIGALVLATVLVGRRTAVASDAAA